MNLNEINHIIRKLIEDCNKYEALLNEHPEATDRTKETWKNELKENNKIINKLLDLPL